MYSIIGVYQDHIAIELDTAETKREALELVREYRMAFGLEWKIKIKTNK
mgnify:FL=1